jgi:hypothetical protein
MGGILLLLIYGVPLFLCYKKDHPDFMSWMD